MVLVVAPQGARAPLVARVGVGRADGAERQGDRAVEVDGSSLFRVGDSQPGGDVGLAFIA